MQATTVLYQMTRYTVEPMAFAEVMLAMRKSILSAQAGLDLLVVDVTIWELLPALLILAASSALVIEVGHTLVTYRLDSHTHKTSTIIACYMCILHCRQKLV